MWGNTVYMIEYDLLRSQKNHHVTFINVVMYYNWLIMYYNRL
jgi:hypothetical protein